MVCYPPNSYVTFTEIKLNSTFGEVIKAGPRVRVPQQRLRSENDQLWGKKKRKVSVSDKQQIDSISRVFVERFEKLQRKKFLSLFTLICCHHIARNISIGKTKHFFNNQINKSLGAQPTKSRISEFFMKKQTILSPIGLLLICSGSHFLMLREALHLCATGDQLRHSLWLKTMKGWKKSCAYTKKEKCFTPQNFIHKLVQKGSKVPMSD